MSRFPITLSHVSFVWPDGTLALDDVSGSFSAGTTGLVGRNGTGKTTLLRLLSGELTPTTGTVAVGGSAPGGSTVAVLAQHLPNQRGRTVAEVLGIADIRAAIAAVTAGDVDERHFDVIGDRWAVEAEALDALASLGLTGDETLLDRDVATLSGGEAMLAGLAAITLSGARVTLLDEPTNNLDRPARLALIDAIRTWRGTLVVVSHDRELLGHVDRIAEVHGNELRTFEGPYATYVDAVAVEQEAARRRLQDAEAAVRKEKRERIEANEKRQRAEARGRKAGLAGGIPPIMVNYLAGRSEATSAASRKLHEGRESVARERRETAEAGVRDDDSIRIELPATRVPSGRRVLEVTVGETDLIVQGPERIALTGRNGAGKSTLLHAITGVGAVPDTVVIGARIDELGMLTQRIEFQPGRSLVDTLLAAAPTLTSHEARAQLAKFLFRGRVVDRDVVGLSGGERFRLALACVLAASPRLLLLDEPTNNLDIDAIDQLVAALSGYEGALIVVSHDEDLLSRLDLSRRWELSDGEVTDVAFGAV